MSFFRVTAIILLFISTTSFASAQGWLKKATGFETPREIQKIAPNGVQLPRIQQAQQSGSSLSVTSGPYIRSVDGMIMSGTSNAMQSPGPTGRFAEAFWDASGRKFWRVTYRDMFGSVTSPIRAQGGDRVPPRPQYSQPTYSQPPKSYPQQSFQPVHPQMPQNQIQPQQHQLDPETQLAVGILQIIGAAIQ